MGRRKSYIREEVTKQAMAVFWRHGFAGTSTKMLSEATGLNPFSIFAEFGSKQGIFDAAVQAYLSDVEAVFANLNGVNAGPGDIRALLAFYGAFARGVNGDCGCFLTNVATQRRPQDPACQEAVDAYLHIIYTGFENCLSQSQTRGELRADVVVVDEAHVFTSMVLGLFVAMRAATQPTLVQGMIRAAGRHLDSLRPA
jgi:TetR/AcrR family transcriptional regulator, transcriptional repressor for nem operon